MAKDAVLMRPGTVGEQANPHHKLDHRVRQRRRILCGQNPGARVVQAGILLISIVAAAKVFSLPKVQRRWPLWVERFVFLLFRHLLTASAITFCYYEILIRLGDRQKFLEEEVRLKSLSNLINETGHDFALYEDFLEETLQLFRDLSKSSDAQTELFDSFNDWMKSQNIITCIKVRLRCRNWSLADKIKLLTSATMNKYPDKYQPYLEIPVKDYTTNRIDPVNSEIENVGLSALFDWLLSPAGIGLTVQYLDRSPGAETTTYSWDPMDHNGMPTAKVSSMTLLYRP
jgi:hypothetical protein